MWWHLTLVRVQLEVQAYMSVRAVPKPRPMGLIDQSGVASLAGVPLSRSWEVVMWYRSWE